MALFINGVYLTFINTPNIEHVISQKKTDKEWKMAVRTEILFKRTKDIVYFSKMIRKLLELLSISISFMFYLSFRPLELDLMNGIEDLPLIDLKNGRN